MVFAYKLFVAISKSVILYKTVFNLSYNLFYICLVYSNLSCRLMLGFMVTTMFLSMWISNTATTAMMVPIVDAVLNELEKEEREKEPLKNDVSEWNEFKTFKFETFYANEMGIVKFRIVKIHKLNIFKQSLRIQG